MNNKTNEIAKSFANLNALKNNLPEGRINEKYVTLFHDEIRRLTDFGFDGLDEFKIPDEEINYRCISRNYKTGNRNYSKERFVDKNIFLIKLDAMLTFFQIKTNGIEVGFKTD